MFLLSSSNFERAFEHFLEQADTYHYFDIVFFDCALRGIIALQNNNNSIQSKLA